MLKIIIFNLKLITSLKKLDKGTINKQNEMGKGTMESGRTKVKFQQKVQVSNESNEVAFEKYRTL